MMKAAVLHEVGGPFVIEDLTLQEPGAGEVLVRMVAAGICHSDWHFVTGALQRPFPVVLGHEGAGVVEEVGAGVTRVRPGDHVILNWSPDCGSCFYCKRGRNNLCERFLRARRGGTLMDGTTRLQLGNEMVHQFSTVSTFAEYGVTDEASCVAIERDVPFEVGAVVGCAVMTGFGAVMNTEQVRADDSVAVYGCGGIGLNILQGAALCGAEPIIAVDRVPEKLNTARGFGATHAIEAGEETVEEIRSLTEGRGADYVYEAVGLPVLQEEAFEAVRPGGDLIIVGVAPRDSTARFSTFAVHAQEKRVVGCLYGTANTRRDFPLILDLYKKGKLKLDELISRKYRLEDINTAYEDLLNGEINRGVIVYS